MTLEQQLRVKEQQVISLSIDLIGLFFILNERFENLSTKDIYQFHRPISPFYSAGKSYITIYHSDKTWSYGEYNIYFADDFYWLSVPNLRLKLDKTITIESLKSLGDKIKVEMPDGLATMLVVSDKSLNS